jgi:hypothetical protein
LLDPGVVEKGIKPDHVPTSSNLLIKPQPGRMRRRARSAMNARNNTEACELANMLASGLIGLPQDPCPDYGDTGFGEQVEPPAQAADGARCAGFKSGQGLTYLQRP